MTKDQYLKGLYAIERVLDGCEGRHSPKQFEVHKECLEYAIKVIRGCEAEDCRSLKDIKEMIERKADALDGQMLDAGGVCIGLYFAIANDLPSVYPKSDKPSGKWEQINKNEVNVIPQWMCSECGAEFECFDMDFEYCPNCGAKMDEEQEQ